jgi:hypothetical protein
MSMALTENVDHDFNRGRACRSRHLFDRTSHSRSRARRSRGNSRIRRFRDGTVRILRISKWQTNLYPVVFLESCHAIPYTQGTRSLPGSRVLAFPEWLKDHEILEPSTSVTCRLCFSRVLKKSTSPSCSFGLSGLFVHLVGFV